MIFSNFATMKVAIINKSDSTGGAAIVSFRLMEALRQEGVEADMLVCEKKSDSPFVKTAADSAEINLKFYLERLKIFLANGLNRFTLFKIDTGETGLPLWKHPIVKEADAVLINWVNQGMLSLNGVKKILQLGKPVIWTMHDMWEMTGICHHAGTCRHYGIACGDCPFLGKLKSHHDLSNKIWKRKDRIFSDPSLNKRLAFVAVSNWLNDKSHESSLLKNQRVEVIPNAFPLNSDTVPQSEEEERDNIRLLFGAARLDDPIKGLDVLREATHILSNNYPEISSKLELIMFGGIKDPAALKGFRVKVNYLGILKGEEAIKKIYKDSDILISSSSYETLPGTLVEAQAYGCIPVSFNQGGQSDIVTHKTTGYLASYSPELNARAKNLAEGIIWAIGKLGNKRELKVLREKMRESVQNKFSYKKVAKDYIDLIRRLKIS